MMFSAQPWTVPRPMTSRAGNHWPAVGCGGYTLMLAALPLSAGALSDRIGARQAFGIGLSTFVAASAACGLAHRTTPPVSLGARPRQEQRGHGDAPKRRDASNTAAGPEFTANPSLSRAVWLRRGCVRRACPRFPTPGC